MKLEDVQIKLAKLRYRRADVMPDGILKALVEAITEYTLMEPPRLWYLLEIPELSPKSTGGWRRIVEIMKLKGYEVTSQADEEYTVNSLAEAYTFSKSSAFRKIITALMIKVSREAGLLHYWHRILFVSAKQILDEDLCEDFDPIWNEKLELDDHYKKMMIAQPVIKIPNASITRETVSETLLKVDVQQQQLTTKVKRRRKNSKPKHISQTGMMEIFDHSFDMEVELEQIKDSRSMPMNPISVQKASTFKYEPIRPDQHVHMMDNNVSLIFL